MGDASAVTFTFANDPLADFSRDDNRQAMQAALADVKRRLGQSYPLVLDGRRVDTAEWIESLNPSHVREIVGRCGKATTQHARDALAAAERAFPAWRDTPFEERCRLLERAADIMRKRRFELAAWEVFECGKQWREADADVAETIDYCRYYADEMRRLGRGYSMNVPGETNHYFYEPRGIAVIIAPWNFPLAILCGMTTAALVTGNTAIMKPAEQSSVIAAKLQEILEEAGAPAGVVQYLPGIGEEIGPTLTEDPRTALVAFTGSRGVGLLLNRQTAEVKDGQDHIKRMIAELGGKNAIIVDDDADLDEAVLGVVASAFGYQGQKCSACSRVIVLQDIHDTFLTRLIEATRSLKLAPAEDPGCRVGPVIDGEARERILGYIEKGKQEARLAYAGDLAFLVNEGFYVAPHIFADVPPTAAIAQEEIFGPVLAVIKVKDFDEALAVANGTKYALTGGLFTRSPEHLARVRRDFRVGNLYINRKITGALVGRQPFGGFKLSGMGSKAGGPDYLLQFVLPRTITENTMRRGFAPAADDMVTG
ncbi:MAG: L-glutamate gamma-semialdehyde dehydrogenase [Gemmataceae bacterium]